MSKRPKEDVGPWAKEKLQALGEYLSFYTKVLKNQGHWCRGTIFIDAFAGPGRRSAIKPRQRRRLVYSTTLWIPSLTRKQSSI